MDPHGFPPDFRQALLKLLLLQDPQLCEGPRRIGQVPWRKAWAPAVVASWHGH